MTACVLACVASAKEKEGGGGDRKYEEKRKGEEGDWGGEKGKQRSLSHLSSPVPPLLPSFFPRIFCPPPPPPSLPFPLRLLRRLHVTRVKQIYMVIFVAQKVENQLQRRPKLENWAEEDNSYLFYQLVFFLKKI